MDFSMFETIENAMTNADYQKMREPVSHSDSQQNNGRFPKHTPLAMAYVPCQQWGETYNIEKGFDKGTVFPELDLPFAPEEGCL